MVAETFTASKALRTHGVDALREIDRSDLFTIADPEMLLKRAKSRKLKSWGAVKQRLPFVR